MDSYMHIVRYVGKKVRGWVSMQVGKKKVDGWVGRYACR